MSIWANREHIGTDSRIPDSGLHHRGVALSYAEGFSNHYPEVDGEYERPASVLVSDVPRWCVPGHEEADDRTTGPWLRLDVNSERHVEGRATGEPAVASVVLDVDAARALAAELLAWVEEPHVYPTASSSERD